MMIATHHHHWSPHLHFDDENLISGGNLAIVTGDVPRRYSFTFNDFKDYNKDDVIVNETSVIN